MTRSPLRSFLIADVGISMGDEGKGRMIPELIEDLRQITGQPSPVAMVLKTNGGANSGHTCGGLKLNLLPAGVIDTSVDTLAIGAGVVADPRKFIWELAYVERHGHDVRKRLLIDQRAQVSDLSHRLLDLAWENYRQTVLGEDARGSTGRGISPAYTDETAHFPIHYLAFTGSKDLFARSLLARLDRACRMIQHVCQASPAAWEAFFETLTAAEKRANAESLEAGSFPESEFDFVRFRGARPFTLNTDLLVETYWEAGHQLAHNVGDVREATLAAIAQRRYVIGEFGQSFWLDKRQGFVPNLTASHTYVPEFFQSAGIPCQPVHAIGVCKAYDTKVGTHVFIARMPDDHPLAVKLKKLEYGTSTGRQRMVGWFDAVEKGDALRYGGFQEMMINKLDALSGDAGWSGDELLVCTAYRDPAGHILRHVPRDPRLHRNLQPVFRTLPGWSENLSDLRRWEDLPLNARRYVAALLEAVLEVAVEGTPHPSADLPNIRYLGVGPNPAEIIKDVPPTVELLARYGQGSSIRHG